VGPDATNTTSDGTTAPDPGTSTTTGEGTSTSTTGETDGATATGGPVGQPCRDDAQCDDDWYCNGAETCVDGFCEFGEPIVCDDGLDCTTDTCNEFRQGCTSIPRDELCDNGVFCDGKETCDLELGCVSQGVVVCDDGIDCTDDACNEAEDRCDFVPDDTPCDNGVFCDGAEVCDSVAGCLAVAPVDCNDLVACTDDSCNEATDACNHVPDDAVCDNGLFCDGSEVCDLTLGCTLGPPVVCPDTDGIACTVETCDEAVDQCSSAADSTLCPAGQFCTAGGCTAGDTCHADPQCDNGIACDGVETCDLSASPGTCVPGVPVDCDDGIGCTLDTCMEPGGTCSHAAMDGLCGDLNPCNGSETCDAASGCAPGTAPDCSDGVDCTIDTCIPSFGCSNAPADGLCQDDSVCNGAERCDGQQGCQPSAGPLQCATDGIACTQDVCDEDQGGCVHVPDDDACACGEVCDTTVGCDVTCYPVQCGNYTGACGDCQDNDGDCRIDDRDPDCYGPCDFNESGLDGEVRGTDGQCVRDCQFDYDLGAGNDDCHWSHECDPLEPSFIDEDCSFDPQANIPGSNLPCAELQASQSQTCLDVCGPVVPNGCDCFGCCRVETAQGARNVWLRTRDVSGQGTCTTDVLDDPVLCRECTQVAGCLNPCDGCEICFGQTTVPPGCQAQECGGVPLCGQPGQAACPPGEFCLTGCCVAF
jgi:hypothetical protein